MNREAWLQLSDYSNKYRVSVSTLRRRIKSGEIQYQFEEGKYWIPDRNIEKYVRQRPQKKASMRVSEIVDKVPEFPVIHEDFSNGEESPFVSREEVLEITNKMISELKSAYVLVLQEKESSILRISS